MLANFLLNISTIFTFIYSSLLFQYLFSFNYIFCVLGITVLKIVLIRIDKVIRAVSTDLITVQ